MFSRLVVMNEHLGMTVAVHRMVASYPEPERYVVNSLKAELERKGYYYRLSDIKVFRSPTADKEIDHVYASVICGRPKRSILAIAGRID